MEFWRATNAKPKTCASNRDFSTKLRCGETRGTGKMFTFRCIAIDSTCCVTEQKKRSCAQHSSVQCGPAEWSLLAGIAHPDVRSLDIRQGYPRHTRTKLCRISYLVQPRPMTLSHNLSYLSLTCGVRSSLAILPLAISPSRRAADQPLYLSSKETLETRVLRRTMTAAARWRLAYCQ